MDEVVLRAGGYKMAGWTSVRVERGLEQQAGAFELELSAAPTEQRERPPVRPGQACQVELGGERVITGYVDDVEPRYSADEHQITARGRDKTGDLIDCSVDLGVGENEIRGRTIEQIARRLVAPYGIEVVTEVDPGGRIPLVEILPEQTVMAVLQELSGYAGVLLSSDAYGRLVITHAGAAGDGGVLERGRNILKGSARHSLQKRYSKYVVQAQTMEEEFLSEGGQRKATAEDPAVPRYRLLLQDVDTSTQERLQRRVEWERNHRAGNAERAQVTVQGWRADDGAIWRPNRRVTLRDDWLGFPDSELLIANVALVRDKRGTRTELTLVRPGALEPRPAAPMPESGDESGGLWEGE